MTLTLDYVMSKSAKRLQGLHQVVYKATVKLIERSYSKGIPILITQGLRTIAEQNALYAQGRTKAGKIVTNAKGGYSNHNFGVAIDFCLLLPDGKNVSWELNKDWHTVVAIAKDLGFEWGGDWKKFKDYPHFEMTFGLSTAQYRAGTKPTETAMAKVLAKIEKEVDEVTRQEYEALSKRVADIEKTLERVPAPAWFVKEFGSADLCGKINDPLMTFGEWRTLAIGLRVNS